MVAIGSFMAEATVQPGLVLLGRYKLEERLGEGGMGAIWRAEHQVLSAPVAVKILARDVAESEETASRFIREAKAAASLRSPHVVQIMDYGVEGGLPFIVMELLEGDTLRQRLKQRKILEPGETVRIVTHVARAMTRAHEAGIVHRDLKPENIFLVKNDDVEIAKVLDFGVAKVEAATLGPDGTKTRTGSLLGTPYYMSPEQAQGNKEVDHRSDLWSLGVIAFECLTGRRPFTSDALGDLVLAICIRPIPVPSELATVPEGFDEWFAKATAREPSDRFQTAREMADAFRECLGEEYRLTVATSPDEEETRPSSAARLDSAPPPSEDIPTILPKPPPAPSVPELGDTVLATPQETAFPPLLPVLPPDESEPTRAPVVVVGLGAVLLGVAVTVWGYTSLRPDDDRPLPVTAGVDAGVEAAVVAAAGAAGVSPSEGDSRAADGAASGPSPIPDGAKPADAAAEAATDGSADVAVEAAAEPDAAPEALPAPAASDEPDDPEAHQAYPDPDEPGPGGADGLTTPARAPVGTIATGSAGMRFALHPADGPAPQADGDGIQRVQSGAVQFPHRFGGSLKLNAHYHVAVSDGVFTRGAARATFHRLAKPSRDDLEDIALNVAVRVACWLRRPRRVAYSGTHERRTPQVRWRQRGLQGERLLRSARREPHGPLLRRPEENPRPHLPGQLPLRHRRRGAHGDHRWQLSRQAGRRRGVRGPFRGNGVPGPRQLVLRDRRGRRRRRVRLLVPRIAAPSAANGGGRSPISASRARPACVSSGFPRGRLPPRRRYEGVGLWIASP
jgi:serine/threonine-protein kinase